MAPVLAIASLVANAVDTTRLFDPVGEIFKPFVTGPNWILVCPARRTAMAAEKRLWNRKERKELARRLQSADPELEIVHPHAAGIDVGNEAHYVAVQPDRDPGPVRRFGCFTADLYRLADWLKNCEVVKSAYFVSVAAEEEDLKPTEPAASSYLFGGTCLC